VIVNVRHDIFRERLKTTSGHTIVIMVSQQCQDWTWFM